jgi:nucleotide-binding universal stress UspA family protein
MKLDRLLVPLDGSMLAETAMWTARDLADKCEATISLLRVAVAYPALGADMTEVAEAEIMAIREAEEYLASAVRHLSSRGFDRVETHVRHGQVAAAIVEAANAQKADMIVMSTHGRSGLSRLIIGSVAESVLRGTTVPILMVRTERAPVDVPGGAVSAKTDIPIPVKK